MRDSGVEVPRSTGWGIDPATVKLLQDAAREVGYQAVIGL